jgi:prevent-host-death family protein
MKRVAAQKLASDLDAVLESAQKERILISRHGKPCAVLVGVEGYDKEDLQYANSPGFWRMIGQRRKRGKLIPLDKVAARLKIANK